MVQTQHQHVFFELTNDATRFNQAANPLMRFQPLGMEGPLAELAGHQLRRVRRGHTARFGGLRWTRWTLVTELAQAAAEQVVVLLQAVDAIRQFLVGHYG